jgi:hypothetical protein
MKYWLKVPACHLYKHLAFKEQYILIFEMGGNIFAGEMKKI